MDALLARLLEQAHLTPASAHNFKMSRKRVDTTATAVEVKRGIVVDPDTRALDPSSSSTDAKPCVATDVENSADQMDEDPSLRAPAISHPLEPDAEENDSKKARVARNLLHILGEDELKSNVNEEAWPNADLAIRSSYEGALIDGLLADQV